MDGEPLTVADVLERAAALIEPEGAWTQGAYAVGDDFAAEDDCHDWPDEPTCFCLMGAIAWVQQLDRPGDIDFARFSPTLGLSVSNVASWNDEPRRKQSEVVAKLREAAALARGAS